MIPALHACNALCHEYSGTLESFLTCLHPVAYIAVINLCYHLHTLVLFIVLFSTLHVSTSAGHPQVFHIYHTTTVLRAHSLLLVPSRH
jgi:hypothetical protein